MMLYFAAMTTVATTALVALAVHSWADALQTRPEWPDYAHDAQIDALGFLVIAAHVGFVAGAAWLA